MYIKPLSTLVFSLFAFQTLITLIAETSLNARDNLGTTLFCFGPQFVFSSVCFNLQSVLFAMFVLANHQFDFGSTLVSMCRHFNLNMSNLEENKLFFVVLFSNMDMHYFIFKYGYALFFVKEDDELLKN